MTIAHFVTTFKGRLTLAGAFLVVALGATLLFSPKALAYGNTLYPGESLQNGAALTSANQQFVLNTQTDGNVVAQMWPKPYWALNKISAHAKLVMQGDGNLVLYSVDPNDHNRITGVVWATNAFDPSGARLVLQDDGNLVVVGYSKGVLWSPNAVPTKLYSGQRLRGELNQTIYSPDRRYRMTMQSDGNIVLYDRGTAIWAKHGGGPNAMLDMQTDANLVLYNKDRIAIWATNKFGPDGSYLEGQNDGNFVIYTPSRGVVWSTRGDSTPTGTRAQLAQQIINHTGIDKTGSCTLEDLQKTAANQPTRIGVWLSEKLLSDLLALANQKSFKITAFTTCGSGHSSTSNHYKGTAVDIANKGGFSWTPSSELAKAIYNNRGGWNINELIFDPMPSGTATLLNGNAFTYNAQTRTAHRDHVHFSVK